MPALGRLWAPDERDANYPLRSLIPRGLTLPAFKYWATGPILDQGNVPACVGYGWRNWMDASTVKDPLSMPPDALSIYARSQLIDGISLPHDGTTVRAGAQVMQGHDLIESYHWAEHVDDVIEYVALVSPVVAGTLWTNDMFRIDSKGFVHPTGSVAGGHCYMLRGVNFRLSAFRGLCAWGPNVLDQSLFWLSFRDFADLLTEQGEACAAKEKA